MTLNQRPTARPFEQRHETIEHLTKGAAKSAEDNAKAAREMLDRASFLGFEPSDEHRLLDFGCGIGGTVDCLVRNFELDAYGVDVYEFWGEDHEHYYDESPIPPSDVTSRLEKLTEHEYRSPFPDQHFDLILSTQVFEHVFDRVAAMKEIKRLLKPNGLSFHIFPGPAKLREPHIRIPIIPFCHSRLYLTAWALLGHRSPRQRGLNWRETVEANMDSMQYSHYPTIGTLLAEAEEAGISVEFMQDAWVEQHDRFQRVLGFAEALGARRLAARVLGAMTQRMMVIRP